MKLSFHVSVSEADLRRHPNGYWVAETDDGDFDSAGDDPMTAMAALIVQIEKNLGEEEDVV